MGGTRLFSETDTGVTKQRADGNDDENDDDAFWAARKKKKKKQAKRRPLKKTAVVLSHLQEVDDGEDEDG